MNQNGKSIQTMDLPTPFDTSERTNGFGANHANLVRRKLFPIPGVANANKDAIQPNLFDGLFPSAAEESKTSEDFFSNLNFSEVSGEIFLCALIYRSFETSMLPMQSVS